MGAGHRGSSWYWRPRLSPQKLKMLDTPEKAPAARQQSWVSGVDAPPLPRPVLPRPSPGIPDRGLQVSLLFSQSSIRGSPPGGSPGGLGLEKGTRRRGLELRPGPSSSLLSGLEGPLDGLSPHGPPGRPRLLGPAPARPGPKADTSPGCSVSVGNREWASERGGEQRGGGEGRGGDRSEPERGPGRTPWFVPSRFFCTHCQADQELPGPPDCPSTGNGASGVGGSPGLRGLSPIVGSLALLCSMFFPPQCSQRPQPREVQKA